ncbi:MAG: hypothetical protein ACYDFT_04885 [Thermoplasmata archaeon]
MMMPRGRPVKSPLSGGSSLRVAADIASAPPGLRATTLRPATQGLFVALIDRQGSGSTPHPSATNWPLWLVPGANRRTSLRPVSSHPTSPRSE